MKSEEGEELILLGCGVLKAELRALRDQYWPGMELKFLDSMLHMAPEKLENMLGKLLSRDPLRSKKVLLVYGDCCMAMTNLARKPGVARVGCHNCCDLLLGKEAYKALSAEGAFFLMPEWLPRWEHIFSGELGLNEANAKDLMGDLHSKIVYLNTGLVPVPVEELEACSRYCGLPWEVMPVSLDVLRWGMQEAVDSLAGAGESDV